MEIYRCYGVVDQSSDMLLLKRSAHAPVGLVQVRKDWEPHRWRW